MSGISRIPSDCLYPPLATAQRCALRALAGYPTEEPREEALHGFAPARLVFNGKVGVPRHDYSPSGLNWGAA